MDLSQTKLAQQNAPLVQELSDIMTEAESLGVSSGVQRIALICDQYDRLSPDIAYQLIDPIGLQNEVEEAQSHRIEILHIIRNSVSVLPLILTWFALFVATDAYQKDTYAGDAGKPFLQLWQEGFHHATPLSGIIPFSVAALTDVLLLVLYFGLIAYTSWSDRQAYLKSSAFAKKLQGSTEKLMKEIARNGIVPIASEADVDRVANAVSRVVEGAMETSKQLMQATKDSVEQIVQTAQQSTVGAIEATQQANLQAIQSIQQGIEQSLHASQEATQLIAQTSQQAIADSNKKVEDLFENEIVPMLKTFNTDVANLQKEVGNYQGRLDELTVANKQLSHASEMLVTNADRYISVGQEISNQIAALNTTQQQVLTQIGAIAANIGAAAHDMNAATISMNSATASMSSASQAVGEVALHLNTGMQTTIQTMTTQVGRATQSLGQVGAELQTTSYYLNKASMSLSSLQFSGRGGLVGWFLARQQNRRKGIGAGAINP